MDPEQFCNGPTGRLVRAQGEYWACVLRPLPPQLSRTPNLVNALSAAEEQRKAALQALFKSLLHQLMTGQIRLTQRRIIIYN